MSRIVLRPIERFRHDPLQSPDRQIRLLSVLPSPDGAIAQYALRTHILNDSKCPYFHALSYEWGSDPPTIDIAINGNLFKIRSNLKDFLDLLRSGHEDYIRVIWIDAICIDQTSNVERNAQVKIMGQIFQSAKLVMTWLGKQDFDDARLVDATTYLTQWEGTREYRRLIRPGSFHEVGPLTRTPGPTPPLLGTAREFVEMWACLRLLCEQTFWSRCWIVQEQVKAQKLLLLWGIQQIPWDTLAIAFRTVFAYVSSQPEAIQHASPWSSILSSIPYKVWLHVKGQVRDSPLLELMVTYRTSKCSVPHDKAYALTGISSDAELLQVDYDKSLPDLYLSLMDLMQERQDCLKYSHLVLEALDLDPLILSRDSTLRSHSIFCDVRCVGQVLISKRIRASDIGVVLETDILQMLVHAGVIILLDELEQIAEWAKVAHSAFRRLRGVDTVMTFFYLSSGQLGVSLAWIMADDTIYSLPGIINGPEQIYVRAESSLNPSGDDDSVYSSPVSPSLSSPTSTSWSDSRMSPVARVWLMDALTPRSPPKETAIKIPVAELVALDPSLGFEFENAPSSPTLSHRTIGRAPSATTHHSAHSNPVGSAIDGAWQSQSPTMIVAERVSTWPIDKLAREMREKLILDPTSALNSPF